MALARSASPAHSPGVAETATPNRRWNSFVCPTCRFIFRVSHDHDGKGVVCPACRVMLRLPGDDASPGPLLLEHGDSGDEFEAQEIETDRAGGNLPWIAGASLAALIVLGLFAWWLIRGSEPKTVTDPLAEAPPAVTETEQLPVERPKTEIAEIDSVMKHFLEAKSVEELQPWIRLPESTVPKIRSWLGGKPYAAPGFKAMAGDYEFSVRNGLEVVVVPVRTANYEKGELVLVKEPAGWRADWESWAGWSEMSWQEFQRERPTEAKLFRIRASKVDYYNFGFKDELEWRSYRLDSPDGEDSLFGYANRGSDTDVRFDPRGVEGKRMLVMLKFPPEAPAENQVLIDRIVAEGWVDPGTPPPP